MENQNESKKKSYRYIGKVKTIPTKNHGNAYKILLDNPSPTDENGNENKYHKGVLIWIDNESGKTFQVKQIEIKGVSERDAGNGFTNSLALDLEDEKYSVTELV